MAKILVVDDEPDIVLFAKLNLELGGHEVRTAADGHEALELLRAERPDALVLDVMMPRVDGWSVLEQLKADPDEAIRTIPVVMLTALGTDHDKVRGGIEGAVRYLTKPVTPDDLTLAVEEVLAGGPEPVQRRTAQQQALTRLARIERGGEEMPEGPRPRLGRLERQRTATTARGASARTPAPPIEVDLTDKQRELLRAIGAASSVSAAASNLGMSRSNVYASLRRIGRKVGVVDVSALLQHLRSGALDSSIEP